MLSYISADQVQTIIRLSETAAATSDRLLDRMYQADVRPAGEAEQQAHSAPGEAEEMVDLAPLGASTMAAPLERLQRVIGDLPPEGRRELHAIMLVGHGDYAAREWEAALTQAEALQTEADAIALAENSDLGPCLAKGLYLLKLT